MATGLLSRPVPLPLRTKPAAFAAIRRCRSAAPAILTLDGRTRRSSRAASTTLTTTTKRRWLTLALPLRASSSSSSSFSSSRPPFSTWTQAAAQGATAVLLPPAVFAGLLLALWGYKCAMMVVFQHKIIYMPFVPWGARRERIADYAADCSPVRWHEVRTVAGDGVEIALCVGRLEDDAGASGVKRTGVSGRRLDGEPNRFLLPDTREDHDSSIQAEADEEEHVVIVYFQGRCKTGDSIGRPLVRYSIVALSYRGYWTSHGRPSQTGIERDAAATMQWVAQHYGGGSSISSDRLTTAAAAAARPEASAVAATGAVRTQKVPPNKAGNVRLVLWGQSVGASVALSAAVQYLRWMTSLKTTATTLPAVAADQSTSATPTDSPPATTTTITESQPAPPLAGLILETPFTSIKDMLAAMYPQRWLPYRYLWPFLRSPWDNRAALRELFRLNAIGEHGTNAASAPGRVAATANFDNPSPFASDADAATAIAHGGRAFPAPIAADENDATLRSQNPPPSPSPAASSPLSPPRILILRAGRDELVPSQHSAELAHIARQHQGDVNLTEVPDALHNEATVRSTGRAALVQFILDLSPRYRETKDVKS